MEQVDMNPTVSGLPDVENYSRSAEVSRLSAGVKAETQPTEKTIGADISQTDITNLVASVNEYVKIFSTKVTFGYDHENERQVILVKDSETGEIIRQIPPREMLNLLKQLEEISGIIYHNHI
jgi:flagellar protein FlaG